MEMERAPLRGETLLADGMAFWPGGKGGNQAVASARYGAETALLGCLGDDAFGVICEGFLSRNGVNLDYLRREGSAATGTAVVLHEHDGSNRIIVAPAANGTFGPDKLPDIQHKPTDVLLAQLEIPSSTVASFIEMGAASNATTVLNVSPVVVRERDLMRLATVLIFNTSEFELQTGIRLADSVQLGRIAKMATEMMGNSEQSTIITMGSRGALIVSGNRWKHIPARRTQVVDTTGPGDCFAGVLAAVIGSGKSLEQGAQVAAAAAAGCVWREGAEPAMPNYDEVWSLMNKEKT